VGGRAEFVTVSLDGSETWNPTCWIRGLRGPRLEQRCSPPLDSGAVPALGVLPSCPDPAPPKAPPAFVPGPTDIADNAVRRGAKAFIWLGIAGLIVLAVFLAQPLLVIFGGVVFASLIEGGQRLLGGSCPARALCGSRLVLAAAVGFLVWLAAFAGSQITSQAAQFPHILAAQAQRALTWFQAHGVRLPVRHSKTRRAGDRRGQPGDPCAGRAVRRGYHVLPDRDPGHLFRLDPISTGAAWPGCSPRQPAHLKVTLQRMGHTLRMLLFGRMIGMVTEGVATWILLAVYGVPMSALLGIMTGLLVFLPNIGAPLSGLLMVLVGFSGGPTWGSTASSSISWCRRSMAM
jgi:hypothetical protein